jgi:hypothetical protein
VIPPEHGGPQPCGCKEATVRTRAALLCFLVLPVTVLAQGAAPRKPNVVFIIADDLGHADVGFTGGTEIKTPRLDALAAAGARLDQFYAQPVCSPTRAALMTGRYPMRHGLQVGVVRPWAQHGLPLDERTLPQALKESTRRPARAPSVSATGSSC